MESSEIFEEWDAYAKERRLVARDIRLSDIIRNAKLKVVAVTGIRRCGKSSLLMLIEQELINDKTEVAYINMEDSRLKDLPGVLDEAIKWFGGDGYLLLDEITSVKGWEGWLARAHEQLKGRLKLVVTSSRKGLALPAKPLRGRILQIGFYPLSFREYLVFKNIHVEETTIGKGKLEVAFKEYLRYGGFPEVVLAEGEVDKIRYLNSYFRDIIGLDIAELTGDDINVIETFARYVLQSRYFSASKCLNFLKTLGYRVGKSKILNLEAYSQASCLFSFIPIFSYNIKDRSQYPRKAYSGDVGFYSGISGRDDIGMPFENLVFLELKRRLKEGEELCYWKDKTGLEVDFLIRRGNSASELVQVAYDISEAKTKKREVAALTNAAKEFRLRKATIITKDTKQTERIEGVEIRSIPVIEWLLS